MPVVTHQSPMGVIDVPSLYRGEWAAGEEHEVTEEQARQLLEQHDLFLPVDDAAKVVAGQLLKERLAAAEPTVDGLEILASEIEAAQTGTAADDHDQDKDA